MGFNALEVALKRSGVAVTARTVIGQPAAKKPAPPAKEADRPARGSRPASTIPNARPALFDQLDRLFVPAYGFKVRSAAEAHLGNVGLTIDQKPRVIVQTPHERVYVEHDKVGSPEMAIDLDPFGDRSRTMDRRYRQPNLVLQTAGSAKPEGAYNVLLLPEGRRTATYYGDRHHAAPWITQTRCGPWDMAVAWERSDGVPLPTIDEATDGFLSNTRIYAAHSARGIIIARRGIVEHDGTVSRYVTEVWSVLLEIFDRKEAQDAIVRPSFRVLRYAESEPVDPLTYRKDLSDDAHETFNRAASIFHHECQSVPKAIATRLASHRAENGFLRSNAARPSTG